MNKLLQSILICCLALSINSRAEEQIRVNADWAVFQYDKDNFYLEVYYSFLNTQLIYKKDGQEFKALSMGELQLFDGESLVSQNVWKNQNVISDTNVLAIPEFIVDQVGFSIPHGNYTCRLSISDLNNPANTDSLEWSLAQPAPATDKILMSDLQLSSSIRKATQPVQSPFYKNTLIVEPNPSSIFTAEAPVLFFYAEIYNLYVAGLENGYNLKYFVTNLRNEVIPEISAKIVEKKNVVQPSVEFGYLAVGELPSGSYLLNVEMLNADDQILARKEKKFYVYQKDQLVDVSASEAENNIFRNLDSTQVSQEYQMINYLLSNEERAAWSSIKNLEGKRNFLVLFWKLRDPDNFTEINESRQEFLKRVEHANGNFRAMGIEGWKTDKGRVYILYGPPSDIERHPYEPNMHPYELWFYHELQNGVTFVFGDLEGHSNYRLLHSNLLGEVQDTNYLNLLRKGF